MASYSTAVASSSYRKRPRNKLLYLPENPVRYLPVTRSRRTISTSQESQLDLLPLWKSSYRSKLNLSLKVLIRGRQIRASRPSKRGGTSTITSLLLWSIPPEEHNVDRTTKGARNFIHPESAPSFDAVGLVAEDEEALLDVMVPVPQSKSLKRRTRIKLLLENQEPEWLWALLDTGATSCMLFEHKLSGIRQSYHHYEQPYSVRGLSGRISVVGYKWLSLMFNVKPKKIWHTNALVLKDSERESNNEEEHNFDMLIGADLLAEADAVRFRKEVVGECHVGELILSTSKFPGSGAAPNNEQGTLIEASLKTEGPPLTRSEKIVNE